MPTTITPTNTHHATLDCPLPKEGASASGMKVTLWQQLADNAEHARQLALERALAEKVPGQSATNKRVGTALTNGKTTNETVWEEKTSVSSGVTYWNQKAVSAASEVVFPIQLFPIFGKIAHFGVSLEGGSGHSALPATMPTVALARRPYDASVGTDWSLVGSVITDGSETYVAYEEVHQVVSGAVDHEIDDNYEYYLVVTGEAGTGSEVGLKVVSLYFSVGA